MFTTSIELPVVYNMMGEEDDYEYGSLDEHFFLWRFITISSYGKAQYLECKNGTMIVSDGAEFFTYLPVDNVESLIAQAKFSDMMNNTLMFNKN